MIFTGEWEPCIKKIKSYLVIAPLRSSDSFSNVRSKCKMRQRSVKLDINSSSFLFSSGFAAQVQLNNTFKVLFITVTSSSFNKTCLLSVSFFSVMLL